MRRQTTPKKQSPKRRTQVKDMPKKETTLNEKEMKKVKGGYFGDIHQPLQVAPKKPISTK